MIFTGNLRESVLILFFIAALTGLYAQTHDKAQDDSEVAQKYVLWIQQAIKENRWGEALAALERASDFADASSDISFLLGYVHSHEGKNRMGIVEALDCALEKNQWVYYSSDMALLLKAEQFIAMKMYLRALSVIDYAGISADSAVMRLLALRGLAANKGRSESFSDPVVQVTALQAAAHFRSRVLETMDRYPRDTRPLRIFFEYARNKKNSSSMLDEGDINLLELALRRLPLILEADPELAWIAYPFIRDKQDARRLVAAYRAGGIPNVRNRDFMPSSGSIAAALDLELLGDIEAAEELFSGSRGFNSPLPPGVKAAGDPVLDKENIAEIFSLLRTEEGRDLFTKKLLSFSGIILSDDDRDGYYESRVFCRSGVIREAVFDLNGNNDADLHIFFGSDGAPVRGERIITGKQAALIYWERYPAVERIELAGETFFFRPVDFQFAPAAFVELGGTKNRAGLSFPVLLYQNTELTRKILVSYCLSIQKPSMEFNGAIEQIFLQRGIPLQAVETLNGKQVSITEFERGLPVIQRLDLDMDGRMETIRRFRRPDAKAGVPAQQGEGFSSYMEDVLDYRQLVISSESDWTGEGIYKTGEVYLEDGSVVYSWDMDGSGVLNYSETGRE